MVTSEYFCVITVCSTNNVNPQSIIIVICVDINEVQSSVTIVIHIKFDVHLADVLEGWPSMWVAQHYQGTITL